ncbi:uncharacterized protein LOC106775026 [Vigna radiata var. radiata]|uniref:Uncharacterized protein LOC106775026 n=1 Tax=Vigna radiata var. radiata TaxID=3916 RepID=A0A1S3VGQ3_VIGRR|nr:uncharacterized protein LOC106775026 [Vigna radiata var. radiata]
MNATDSPSTPRRKATQNRMRPLPIFHKAAVAEESRPKLNPKRPNRTSTPLKLPPRPPSTIAVLHLQRITRNPESRRWRRWLPLPTSMAVATTHISIIHESFTQPEPRSLRTPWFLHLRKSQAPARREIQTEMPNPNSNPDPPLYRQIVGTLQYQ